MAPFDAKLQLKRVATLGAALAGAGLFLVAELPLPWLLGPMAACLLLALAGAPMADHGRLSVYMRTILGVAVGASIKPELVQRLPEIGGSLAFIPLFVLVIGLIGYPYFRHVCSYSRPTAYFGAMPGGLQDMLVFGKEAGADIRTLSLVHATRVLVIVSLVPVILQNAYGLAVAGQPTPGLHIWQVSPFELAIMVGCAVGGLWFAERIKLFGASIVGPLIVAAAASLSGLLTHRPPVEAIIAAQLFIGMSVGVQYRGVTLREIVTTIAAALVYCLLLAAIAYGFAQLVTLFGFAPPLEGFLAYAPGGQAEMTVMAIVVGADVAFVATHHILRIVVVILGAPLVLKLFRI